MSTNKDTGHHSEYVPLEDQKIINVEINKEMRKSFLDYSMSVIVSRALPDVRDGLKPVHRRILYTMSVSRKGIQKVRRHGRLRARSLSSARRRVGIRCHGSSRTGFLNEVSSC